MNITLENKIVLVTGASRGIGKAIALALAKAQATVIGTATSEQGAASITQAFEQAGLLGRGVALDVTQPEAATHVVSQITEQYGAPDILINNAGITRDNLLLRMSDDEWESVLETNLTGVYRLCKACLREMMRKRWGRIINISSVVGFSGNAGQVNYTAAKAGLVGFSKSLAQEIASRNITVNIVAPGFIETDMTRSLPSQYHEELIKRIPMKRVGQTEDIAAAVIFLASEQACYITGMTMHVNGGMYMT